jgi:hypothetical protein
MHHRSAHTLLLHCTFSSLIVLTCHIRALRRTNLQCTACLLISACVPHCAVHVLPPFGLGHAVQQLSNSLTVSAFGVCRGDNSPDFSFASFYPRPVQPFIDKMAGFAGRLVRLSHPAPLSVTSTGPNAAPAAQSAEANRRR